MLWGGDTSCGNSQKLGMETLFCCTELDVYPIGVVSGIAGIYNIA